MKGLSKPFFQYIYNMVSVCISKKRTVSLYDGFVGGCYSSTPPSNTQGYCYARDLSDQGGLFSNLNWYDRVNNVIVSQNTKQRNYSKAAYTYTIYDALNRIVEVGQKTENTDTTNTFNKIFGDTVMGFYNSNAISRPKFISWVKDSSGPRTQVTHKYYDIQDILPINVFTQNETRNRIATVTYVDTLRKDSTKFNNATDYSYDVHGNVSTIIQDDSVLGVGGQRYKRLDYQYDLVSGNVNEVDYQSGDIDQYHHKFSYDADNRMTQVQTSKDSILWDNDANYLYYADGKLARIEIGDQQVQGVDVAYTLQGWIKGVNSDLLDSNRDMGHDGLQVPGNLNKYFARDAFGYTLKYFKGEISQGIYGDYDAINSTAWNNNVSRFEARDYNSDLMNERHDLYNGNITAMVTNIQKPTEYATSSTKPIPLPQGTAYKYDQLSRLADMKAYLNLDTDNVWGNSGTYNGLYHNWFTYDANGNILKQNRADSLGETFDSLTYQYNIQGGRTLQNRLYHINDSVNISGIHYDLKNQGTFNGAQATINQKNNYRYNALGELAKDSLNGIDTIVWTMQGKMWKIKKYSGDSLLFTYDGKGDRVIKEFKPASGSPISTYYIHDAQGQVISVYSKQINNISMTTSYILQERNIYGAKRIGTENTPVEMIGGVMGADTVGRYLGFKEYELDNHLNNVLSIVSDRKIPRPNASLTAIDHYEADIMGANDYYPFGMLEPGRNFNSVKYRYAFNGKEKTDEVYGTGDGYDYGMRFYDTRVGRFVSVDPLAKKYPFYTPFQFGGNMPIRATDIDGLEPSIDPSQSGSGGNKGSSSPGSNGITLPKNISPKEVKDFEQGQKDLAEQQKQDADSKKLPVHPLSSTEAKGDAVISMAPQSKILQNAQANSSESSSADNVDDLAGLTLTAADAANKTLNAGAQSFGAIDKTISGLSLLTSVQSLNDAKTTSQKVVGTADVLINTGGLAAAIFEIPVLGQVATAWGYARLAVDGVKETYDQALEYNLNRWSAEGTHYLDLKEHSTFTTKTYVSQHR